ncbi:CCD81 protein, partial [Fregata magnificens]|nr:CCD81 protein [Fregata magnificens]
LGGLFTEDLGVAEVIYTEVALRLHIPKAKVLKCIEATMKVFVWALSKQKNFDFVFKNLGILVCRKGRVIMRFFEDLLRDVDKTGKLANSFLQV